uniref:Poly(A) binding protein nuclear 1 n=1 Tax=Ovis aries TaxID=9940 RepID=A0AC11EK81_SHEEP
MSSLSPLNFVHFSNHFNQGYNRDLIWEQEGIHLLFSLNFKNVFICSITCQIFTGPVIMSIEEKMEADARSIYVGNVDYGATAEELEAHFHGCGSVNRVTILCDKFSGHPKGFAYIEFSDKESVRTSLALDESLFRGRQIKVIPKRTNRPGISTTDRGFPRARYRARTTNYNSSRSRFYSGFNSRPPGSRLQGPG